jgi:hypothetical protein
MPQLSRNLASVLTALGAVLVSPIDAFAGKGIMAESVDNYSGSICNGQRIAPMAIGSDLGHSVENADGFVQPLVNTCQF